MNLNNLQPYIRKGKVSLLCMALILSACGKESNSTQMLEGIDIEVSNDILEHIEISNCETSLPFRYYSYEIDCVFKYKGTTGEIVPYFFGAIAYDKDGVRLNVQSFPNQNLLPNQPVKSPLLLNVPISDVRKIVIGISYGDSVITK